MESKKCQACGAPMKRNGKTSSGRQRWRCRSCGSSSSHRHDSAAKDLGSFVRWLLSKDSQLDMPGQGLYLARNF